MNHEEHKERYEVMQSNKELNIFAIFPWWSLCPWWLNYFHISVFTQRRNNG